MAAGITVGELLERAELGVTAIAGKAGLSRTVAVPRIQKPGLALAEIEAQLAQLPQGRAPTLSDWQAISRRMRFEIDQRINLLTRTRNQLDQCIGCGCLSLEKCQLYNKDDRLGAKGAGPQAILG